MGVCGTVYGGQPEQAAVRSLEHISSTISLLAVRNQQPRQAYYGAVNITYLNFRVPLYILRPFTFVSTLETTVSIELMTMPTVIRPNDVVVGKFTEKPSSKQEFYEHMSLQSGDCGQDSIQTSVCNADSDTIVASKNGHVNTVLRAWEQHLHLELRPDDVWLAVLVQFSFFVNGPGRAELLRDRFVAHEGKQDLVVFVEHGATAQNIDMTALTEKLVDLVKERMVDETMADRLLPTFSTTLPSDRTIAAAVFLGTMKQYFAYGVQVECGFPSVTLLGECSDWADLARRPFCWWRADGMRQKAYSDEESQREYSWADEKWQRLEVSGVNGFPVIDQSEIPIGLARVPIAFGNQVVGEEGLGADGTETILLAGSGGMKLLDGRELTRVAPFSSWWLLQSKLELRERRPQIEPRPKGLVERKSGLYQKNSGGVVVKRTWMTRAYAKSLASSQHRLVARASYFISLLSRQEW
ncbi:hypothetical protein BDP81DRAFT_454193 [Colletotrichum phormii]|uniref:Uncharacterized protein n=1 Tax=Colletotrichum phormii TaxID=359342 RepID=A0AAI9ZGF1_9PEZI|nr:uncharacterized protein BDP81DRAFT_454193 [Colletotrichum phormii]KAK1623743.1 hypothetical protein BDP81DRAFT_454193 [Colletotrichum phormii]